jgi:hypothetical protein
VLLRCRDGAEKSYFVCQTTWGCGPATLLDYSSRLDVGRRESRTSRRFAPGLEKEPPGMAALQRICSR